MSEVTRNFCWIKVVRQGGDAQFGVWVRSSATAAYQQFGYTKPFPTDADNVNVVEHDPDALREPKNVKGNCSDCPTASPVGLEQARPMDLPVSPSGPSALFDGWQFETPPSWMTPTAPPGIELSIVSAPVDGDRNAALLWLEQNPEWREDAIAVTLVAFVRS